MPTIQTFKPILSYKKNSIKLVYKEKSGVFLWRESGLGRLVLSFLDRTDTPTG